MAEVSVLLKRPRAKRSAKQFLAVSVRPHPFLKARKTERGAKRFGCIVVRLRDIAVSAGGGLPCSLGFLAVWWPSPG